MGKSTAATAEDYLSGLADGRRQTVAAVRQIILDNLPAGYQETIAWGMLSYVVPLERYPKTYNKQPLSYIALASHKSFITLYLMCVYNDSQQESWLKQAFADAGKKLDMGKSCLHFRTLDDLPLDAIAALWWPARRPTSSSPNTKPAGRAGRWMAGQFVNRPDIYPIQGMLEQLTP